jgi:hypothetical protein
MIFEGKFSHKSLLFDFTPYIESLYINWNGIQYRPFYFLPFQFMLVHISKKKSCHFPPPHITTIV